ncbi:MAG TPA: dihydrofolate reductase family protein [Bryobacteraceae bacterium]|jgi:dihydrofolate reductase|nr:dihydrofolate reductase family protein [Bryobacteraceae bacterium]
MPKLIYATPTSLDGYIADDGHYDWSTPADDWFTFINALMRPIGTYLYGRKTYETMAVWQTPEVIPGLNPDMEDFARIWQAAAKIVYSTTLENVSTPRTRLERQFDAQAIRDLKAHTHDDISVAGPDLAAQAIRAGLVDEYHLFVVPVIRGNGKRILPTDVSVKLDLLEDRRFANGWMYLRYRTQA